MLLIGIEPISEAPEASVLSIELQEQNFGGQVKLRGPHTKTL